MNARGTALAVALTVMYAATAGTAGADPDPVAPDTVEAVAAAPDTVEAVAAAPDAAPAAEAQPVSAVVPPDDGAVDSSSPQTTTAPDGTTLTISAEDETQRAVAPLTTAISTREYAVGGVYNGAVEGGSGGTPEGVFEVGYQIGCGIDMSTSNGVSMTGTAGVGPSIQFLGIDATTPLIDAIIPGIGANFAGGVTVGLKPGLINVVPVTKKEYKGAAPWVSISNFRVKIDGCVGESFIRSYATLTRSTDEGDAILSWYGATKAV